MDPETGIKIVAAYVASKEVVGKILGPTADYLGVELQHWTQRRVENVGRIFRKAEEKLGDRINEEGRVPPKVLKEILDDGSFAEDELAAEYFGGVLASSRSGVDRDDRGASLAKLVAQLTAYQLQSHFFFYHLFKMLHDGTSLSVADDRGRSSMRIFVPFSSYATALELTPEEDGDQILTHCMFGLARIGLILDSFYTGNVDHLKSSWDAGPGPGILVNPSVLGVELFHWAHGLGSVPINHFLDPQVQFRSSVRITTTPGFMRTEKLPEEATDGELSSELEAGE